MGYYFNPLNGGTFANALTAPSPLTINGATSGSVAYGATSTGSNATINNLTITNPGSAITATLPSTSFTVARTDAAQTFTGNQTVSGNLLANSEATNTIGNNASNRFIIYPYSLSLGTTSNSSGEARFFGTTSMIRMQSGFLQMGSAANLGWSSGDPSSAAEDISLTRAAAKVMAIGDGSANANGWFTYGGTSRVSTQFDKTDTTLANVTGLSVTVAAGRTYSFKATLHLTLDATGGQKVAIAGTATATAIVYQVNSINNSTNLNVINSRQTALAGAASAAGGTSDFTTIEGLITVANGGTLTVQFSESAATGTGSVLVGSTFIVQDVP